MRETSTAFLQGVAAGGGCLYLTGARSQFFRPESAHSSPFVIARRPRYAPSVPRRAVPVTAVDSTAIVSIGVSVLGVAAGVGLLIFTEKQGLRTAERENLQPCVDCRGTRVITCKVCRGDGKNPLTDQAPQSSEDNPESKKGSSVASKASICSYCEGEGKIRCFNCSGTGIQPRFLDRLSPEDFMD